MQINGSNLTGFIDLPEELNNKILNCVVDIKTAILCEYVCKLWNAILTNNPVFQREKERYLERKIPKFASIPKDIVDAFGGVKKVYSFPSLDLGQYCADYLSIQKDQMSAPIMRGVDCKQRAFICMKIKIDKSTNNYSPINEPHLPAVVTCVATFFNRWTDDRTFRTNLGFIPDQIFGPASGINEEHVSNIKKFVADKKLEGTMAYHGQQINYSYLLAD